ncbi:MAG: hypothetical protein HGA27_03780 [Peptococcaceae bacterium]|nr:hypothetical protein [Peptococcaceae bacterium]
MTKKQSVNENLSNSYSNTILRIKKDIVWVAAYAVISLTVGMIVGNLLRA